MQREAFLDGEGDRYFERNELALERCHERAMFNLDGDPVLRALQAIQPRRLLEIGCATGWRLDIARRAWKTQGYGTDPSASAITHGRNRYPGTTLSAGTADRILFSDAFFDCVVFGFCLYLCDRADLFRIAAEADRVLADGGYLVVYDFCPPESYSRPYAHRQGVLSYKMDHSRLWSWHPAYSLWCHDVTAHEGASPEDPDERLAVTVLRKAHPPGR